MFNAQASDDGLDLPDKQVIQAADGGLGLNPNVGNLFWASFWIPSAADATLFSDTNMCRICDAHFNLIELKKLKRRTEKEK